MAGLLLFPCLLNVSYGHNLIYFSRVCVLHAMDRDVNVDLWEDVLSRRTIRDLADYFYM